MTAYPSISDYVEAVQDPLRAFREPDLQQAEFALDPQWHIPVPVSGNAAVVFRAAITGRDQALRFFIREDVSEKRRYTALDHHFVTNGLADCVARTSWVDEAIRIDDRWWPMVRMEWVDGERLDDHVRALAARRDAAALDDLALAWRQHVRRLQAAEFAHGDLQHGNVLVEPRGGLRLVDFDGSWVEAFEDLTPPKESGHPNYQHVGRTWGRWMDTYPALVIYTGLLSLSRRPDAWRNNEGMLFTREDLLHPGDTPAWRLVTEIADPQVALAVGRLRSSCDPDWCAAGDLEDLLGRERITPALQAKAVAHPVFQLTDRPTDNWQLAGHPVDNPASTEIPPERTFGGVHGVKRPVGPAPTRPVLPPPCLRSQPSPSDTTVSAAFGIALVLAMLLGSVVGANGGPGVAVGFLTAVLAFAVALPLLRNRR